MKYYRHSLSLLRSKSAQFRFALLKMNGKFSVKGVRISWCGLGLFVVLLLVIAQFFYLDLSFWSSIFPFDFNSITSSHSAPIECYDDLISNRIEDISDIPPQNSDLIFFHETLCASATGSEDFIFTPRQACAVESAARANPNAEVNVLFLSPISLSNVNNTSNMAVRALLKYSNIRLKHVSLKRYMKGTPLEGWYESGALKKSQWPTSHASDVMRYLTLWKYSGTYLDLDVVVLKPFENLRNFAGAESPRNLGAGVINIDSSSTGRALADAFLHELLNTFRGTGWGDNGPGVITRVLRRLCHVNKVQDMTQDRCGGFTVHPPSVFYPISFEAWDDYFNESKCDMILKLHRDSYVAHLSNKFSGRKNITVGSKQPYGLLAAQNCPRVYETCVSVF